MIENYLKGEEKFVFSLRALYSKYGYLPYKMNKFEEYDLYAKNKDFLVSDSIITFTDTNGKLMALKPDVTLSIIKNANDEKGTKNKVYYSENVYRVSGSTREYKEIMQTGLELIGDLDIFDTYEVISLAKSSLESISKDYVLEISHMGIISAILNKISDSEELYKKALECIGKKSMHAAESLAAEYNLSDEKKAVLSELCSLYGTPDSVISRLEKLLDGEKTSCIEELKEINALIKGDDGYEKVRFDFSIVNDMNYYNGIVINGYINGICECVLFGGEYDNLLSKMGKKSRGIGFAIYTDLLSGLSENKTKYDVDTLILYSDNTDKLELKKLVNEEISAGKSVSAQKQIPKKLRYKEIKEI